MKKISKLLILLVSLVTLCSCDTYVRDGEPISTGVEYKIQYQRIFVDAYGVEHIRVVSHYCDKLTYDKANKRLEELELLKSNQTTKVKTNE